MARPTQDLLIDSSVKLPDLVQGWWPHSRRHCSCELADININPIGLERLPPLLRPGSHTSKYPPKSSISLASLPGTSSVGFCQRRVCIGFWHLPHTHPSAFLLHENIAFPKRVLCKKRRVHICLLTSLTVSLLPFEAQHLRGRASWRCPSQSHPQTLRRSTQGSDHSCPAPDIALTSVASFWHVFKDWLAYKPSDVTMP